MQRASHDVMSELATKRMAEGGLKVLNVLLLGKTGRGKSTTGNKLINVGVDSVLDLQLVRDGQLKREWPEEPTYEDWGLEEQIPLDPICFAAGKGTASVTQECSVIVNTKAGFRVMDTRGFAHSESRGSVYLANLQIMREVVGITAKKKLLFHRVLYFLPERDIPERADGYLQEELQVLWHFYGANIFKNMVIVVTAPPRSKATNPDIDAKFGDGATRETQSTFLEALKNAIHRREDAKLPPCPDIIFIPLPATAESVAEIVRNAKVCEPSGIRLEFRETTCSKCGSVIHIRMRKGTASIAGAEVEEGRIRIPEESKCHPALIPKYTKLEKFVGGVGHLVTLGIPQGVYYLAGKSDTVWPWFTNSEEKCAKCECAPGVKGCTKVGEMYKSFVVEHNHHMLTVRVESQ